MTESTGYLDMNKKNLCHPNKINQLSLLFCFLKKGFFVFQTEPNSIDRSIDRSLLTQKKTLPPKSPRNTLPSIVSYSLRPEKKNFHAFFQKKIFFPPPTGIRTHIKKILVSPTACAKRAPLPPIPRARAPAAAAAAAAAAAHQHHHLIESGSEKREGYRTSVSTKIRSVSNLCMNPNPLSPRSPFFQPTGQRFPTLARG